jgi:preprotein translocase subunit SecG
MIVVVLVVTVLLQRSAGTAIGEVAAPFLFGNLVETGSRASVFGGYLFGSGLMVLAAIIEMI